MTIENMFKKADCNDNGAQQHCEQKILWQPKKIISGPKSLWYLREKNNNILSDFERSDKKLLKLFNNINYFYQIQRDDFEV